MEIFSIIKSSYDTEIRGFGIHPISYKTFKEAEDYLLIKGYKSIYHNQYEIRDDSIRYIAEIVKSEL